MTRACLAALLSFWRRNPLQLFTFMAGLALATALWSGVQAINAEARASYDAAANALGAGQYDYLHGRDTDTIAQSTYITLRRAGWQVAPLITGSVTFDDVTITLIGIDPLTAPAPLNPVQSTQGLTLVDALTTGLMFANPDTLKALTGKTSLTLIETAALAPKTALTDIGIAQRLLDQPDRLSRLILLPDPPAGLPPLNTIAPDLQRVAAGSDTDLGQLTGSFHLNLTAFGLLSFAVGIFIVHGAIGLAFEQRRAMIRTLRALGMPLGRLIVLLCSELLVLSAGAGMIGVALGYMIASVLLPDVAATLKGLYGADVAGSLQLRPSWWLSGLAISIAGTAVAATSALIKIARMPILASAQPRAWAVASGRGRVLLTVAAAALLGLAALLVALGSGLVAGFLQLGCLLIGAALALPLILDRVLTFGQSRAKDILPQWFWADTRQQLSGLSLALMALLLAIAANVGVSTMVSSFRLTFVDFLDQRLAPELYVQAETPAQGPALETFLTAHSREVLPLRLANISPHTIPSELYGVRAAQTYREHWRFLDAADDPWNKTASGTAALVNEQFARRAGLWVGDTLDLGMEQPFVIAGVFGDYGNPIGKVLINEALFQTHHPDHIATQFGVRTNDAATLRDQLITSFGLPAQNITDQAQIKALSLRIFERTFTVTGALNILTLAVAAFAILMSLLTLAAIRLPQLAPIWALGVTRRRLGQIEMLRAMLLALLTTALAIPLGLALAWVLLAVVNVEAFGWRLPMYLFPGDYLRLGLFALLAAGIAALWPALKLAKLPPSALLKVFASER